MLSPFILKINQAVPYHKDLLKALLWKDLFSAVLFHPHELESSPRLKSVFLKVDKSELN